MKRKLLNGLLLASALVGVGTLQSCKDYESDLQNEWNQSNLDLEQKINLLNTRLNDLKVAQEACKAECQAKFAAILTRLDGHDRNISNLSTSLTQAWIEINKLKDQRPGHTDGQIVDLIKTTLIEYGWPTEDGELSYVDMAALLQAVKDNAAEIANLTSLYNQLDYRMGKIETWKTTVDTRLAALEAKICQCQPGLTEDQVKALAKAEAEKLVDALRTEVTTLLSSLQTQVTQNTETINQLLNLYNNVNTRLTKAEADAIEALTLAGQNKDALDILKPEVENLRTDLTDLESRVDQNETDISQLKTDVEQLLTDVEDLTTKYEDLDSKFEDLNTTVGEHTTAISNIESVLETLASQADLDALTERVAANESAIQALQGDVAKLFKIYDRLNAMVTGIIVEGAYNPLFGTFSLPIGVQNNMLVNYYGVYEGTKNIDFPSVGTVGDDTMLTAAEAANLAGLFTPETIKNGDILMDGNLGKVYLTINPSNVNLSGVDLELQKSNGEKSPVVLKNVKKSDHVLMFGGSRAGEGFYEADAVLPMDAQSVGAIRVTVSDGLKSSVKDLLKDRSKRNVYNLMRGVYDQISEGLPAYSVKHSWTVDDGQGAKTYSVFSGYDMAAVTFRPLSYNTYAGQSINHRLKKHGPLKTVKEYFNELVNKDKFHFSLDAEINLDPKDYEVTFNLDKVHFEIDPYTGELYAESDGLKIYDKQTGAEIGYTEPIRIPVNQSDLDDFVKDLVSQLEDNFNKEGGQLGQWNDQLQSEYNEALTKLVGDVQKEVNNALANLEGSINDQIDDILNDIRDGLSNKTQGIVDKFNKFIDKYNKVVDKVNNFLEDPNHYLQVAMVYNAGNGNLELVSNDSTDPTVLKKGNGNAATFYASSYTAEIAAPAYKKFFAITQAWDASGNPVSKSEIQALNKAAAGSLCTVLPGRTKRVAIPAGQMKAGYKYQILYTAVDYHGYTSTQRFYVTVK